VGNAAALRLHERNGTEVLTVVALVQLVLAVLVWRPGRARFWPVPVALLILAAEILQIGYGFAGRLAVHVPLGVAIFGLSLVLLLAPIRRSASGVSLKAAPVGARETPGL
jgi:hypothetical protein